MIVPIYSERFAKNHGWLARYYFKPFETTIAVYVIFHAILSCFWPTTPSTESMWLILGALTPYVIYSQAVSGTLKLVGIALAKVNLEVAGLIMILATFLIRAISMIATAGLNSTINIQSFGICLVVIVGNSLKIHAVIRRWRVAYYQEPGGEH